VYLGTAAAGFWAASVELLGAAAGFAVAAAYKDASAEALADASMTSSAEVSDVRLGEPPVGASVGRPAASSSSSAFFLWRSFSAALRLFQYI
jgi:hypothetical protein